MYPSAEQVQNKRWLFAGTLAKQLVHYCIDTNGVMASWRYSIHPLNKVFGRQGATFVCHGFAKAPSTKQLATSFPIIPSSGGPSMQVELAFGFRSTTAVAAASVTCAGASVHFGTGRQVAAPCKQESASYGNRDMCGLPARQPACKNCTCCASPQSNLACQSRWLSYCSILWRPHQLSQWRDM